MNIRHQGLGVVEEVGLLQFALTLRNLFLHGLTCFMFLLLRFLVCRGSLVDRARTGVFFIHLKQIKLFLVRNDGWDLVIT